jgi:hypothetical protein
MHPETQAVEYQLTLFDEGPIRLTPIRQLPPVKRESKPPARVYWPGPYRDSSHAYCAKDVDA